MPNIIYAKELFLNLPPPPSVVSKVLLTYKAIICPFSHMRFSSGDSHSVVTIIWFPNTFITLKGNSPFSTPSPVSPASQPLAAATRLFP